MAWNTAYPIGQLIAEAAETAGFSANDLVACMGYRNLNKGRRRLEHLLANGEAPETFSGALRESLAIGTEAWATALLDTREIIATEEEAAQRDRFRPYIFVVTQGGSQGTPLFIKAFTAGQKLLPVPKDWFVFSTKDLVGQVSKLVAKHFHEKDGEISVHGNITGYRFHMTYDHTIELGTDGVLLEPFADPGQEPLPTLFVKGKPIPRRVITG